MEDLRLLKEQKVLLNTAPNQSRDLGLEEIKHENTTTIDQSQMTKEQLIDSYIGKYKTEDEVKIGDRRLDELVEIKEKNN